MELQSPGLFSDPTLQSAKLVLTAAAARHEAIAANIANVNTPGYQRADLAPTFQSELSRALGELDARRTPSSLPTPSIARDASATAARLDGNTVSLDRELMALTENNAMHEFAAEVVRRRYSGLRTAITGRASQ